MKLSQFPNKPAEFYQAMPKVDLHRHLEGSLRFDTVRELARAPDMDLPHTAELRGRVQVLAQEPASFKNFLSKFTTLRLFYRSEEIITRITREAIEDAAADQVRYLELRFTPVALARLQAFPLGRVMDWVTAAARQASQEIGITTRLIASVNRHESVALAAQVALLAAERMPEGIVGLDLAGDEVGFPAEPFLEVFRYARHKGLHLTVHAGEWGSGENVLHAIQTLGAERIGHGIRVLESPQATEVACKARIPFEVCLTSNYHSGVVPAVQEHPLRRMLEAGLLTTLNTDDPSISQITLSDEYRLACEMLGLPLESLRQHILSAAQAAFLPKAERAELVHTLELALDDYLG